MSTPSRISRKPTYASTKTLLSISILALFLLSSPLFRDSIFFFIAALPGATTYILEITRNPKVAHAIGNYYFNGGTYDLEVAKSAYMRSIKLDPKAEFSYFQLARIKFLEGDHWYARENINKAILLNPSMPNFYYARGLIHGYMGLLKEAETDFTKAAEMMPTSWAAHNDLAWIQITRGRLKEAEDTIRRVFKEVPTLKKNNPWLWTNLGIVHLNLEVYSEAKRDFTRAALITEEMSPEKFLAAYPGNNPQMANAAYKNFVGSLRLNLAIVNEKDGVYKEALYEYKKASSYFGEGRVAKQIRQKITELSGFEPK